MAEHLHTASRTARLEDGTSVAYVDQGDGSPVLLLHGCPFSAFVWREVIGRLGGGEGPSFRCIAPDLLGLGDTETAADANWGIPEQASAILGLLDQLGLQQVAVVGHDQGGAVAQLLTARHPGRVAALVLANAEAYDNWPSAAELPFVRATQLPVIGRAVLWAWSRRPLFRWALDHGQAVHDTTTLTDELVDGYIAANLATAHRRAKTRRFLAAQLDPSNQSQTASLVEDVAASGTPVLILWGGRDVHFDSQWAERLHRDLPGSRLRILPDAGHLVMEEEPEQVARLVADFLHEAGGA